MTSFHLKSPAEAEVAIANLLKDEYSNPNGQCSFFVRDDRAFQSQDWLKLGILHFPFRKDFDDLEEEKVWINLVKLGAFEWHVTDNNAIEEKLKNLLGHDAGKEDLNLGTLTRDISCIAVRAGLLLPTFDPAALDEMPYRRSTTIISDTSGVVQGGLDFVARHLSPGARIKVPSIVHMELVGAADNYFRLRRATRKKNAFRRHKELTEHLKSQGGQRSLLRLELHQSTEIERTFLLGDPLREAFSTDNDQQLSGLNISLPIKSYADRLILEAARQHQAHSGPGHEIRLLTADQGLARMALAEGILPLYFETINAERFFGTYLTGRTFDPFQGSVRGVSLATLLWEFATAFGSARLEGEQTRSEFWVSALREDLSWAPYHSVEDLLWCQRMTGAPKGSASSIATRTTRTKRDIQSKTEAKPPKRTTTYRRFDVSKLLRLVCELDDAQQMNEDGVVQIVQTKHARGFQEYERFLLSGGFITKSGETWTAEPPLMDMSAALRNENVDIVRSLLSTTPSFHDFMGLLGNAGVGHPLETEFAGRSSSTYRTLGEIVHVCAAVRGKGIFSTATALDAKGFAEIAVKRFRQLDKGDGLVSTGKWLETLVEEDGIHPEVTRKLLEEARQRRLLRRSTEGSTMQMRFRTHIVHVLRVVSGVPTVVPVHLYRGDYLIPDKASASLRIEEVDQ